MKKRKIAVVTGTRAEYGILRPLLEKIKKSVFFELLLIVTGMHLLEEYGMSIREIEEDGFLINAKVMMYKREDPEILYHGRALARGVKGFTEVLSEMDPDVLVVIGDRLEPLAAALAASTLNIVIAHIHGGDKTDSGHIDESIRHSITRFSHIHFTATKSHTERLIKMGEEPWRIFEVGALALDSVVNCEKFIPREELFPKLGISLKNSKVIVCVFHPVHLERESAREQIGEIMNTLEELKIESVVIYPNNDGGSKDIIKEIERYKNLPFIKIFPNLSHSEYISLLKCADVLIGNSSSGIIEAPSIGLPVVNIGSRNTGREHADNVIFVDAEREKIEEAIKVALYDEEFVERARKCKNPYGDGRTSERIVDVLSKITIDKELLRKKITY